MHQLTDQSTNQYNLSTLIEFKLFIYFYLSTLVI